jgi:hypothetical protein
MTPKEKAIELMDKFYQTTPNESWINQPIGLKKEYKAWEQSKQCALIAVDLHLEELSKMKLIFSDREIHCKYWQEVKNEINQLIIKNK